jgi:hypothetical protein
VGTLQAATNITVVPNGRTKDMSYLPVFSFQVVFGLNFNSWLVREVRLRSQPINFCVLLGFLQTADTDLLGQYRKLVKLLQRFRVDVG